MAGETAEKKQETGKEVKKAKKKEKKGFSAEVPLYLGVLLLVFGFVLGFALNGQLNPSMPLNEGKIGGNDCPPQDIYPKVLLKILYSGDCEFCDESSLRNVFDAKGIDYTLEKVDVKGKEKEFKERFGVKFVPTALVEVESLEANPDYREVAAIVRANFEEKEGFYVVPESSLDKLPHPIMFLEPLEGFTAAEGRVRVEQFCDFQREACYNALETVDELRKEFGEEIEYRYRHFLLGGTGSEAIAIGSECARDQNVFDEFMHLILKKRFEEGVSTTVDYVIKTTGIEAGVKDIWKFEGACIDQRKTADIAGLNGEDMKTAAEYGLRYVPSYVIDSRYVVVMTEQLKEKVCLIHPELSACSK